MLLDVEELPLRRSWYVVYRKGRELSIVARTFFDYLKEEGVRLERELEEAQSAPAAHPKRSRRPAGADRRKKSP